MSLCDCTIKGW